MEFKEINVREGIVQQIDHERPFAGITVELGNVDHIYSNFNHDVTYEDTLEDIEKINMERARYLLSTDEMLDEMLSKTQG